VAAQVPTQPDFFCTASLDQLLPLCLDPVLEVRHGALAGISQLLPALAAAGRGISAERLAAVAAVVPEVEAAKLLRGKGGALRWLRWALHGLAQPGR
jgi:hypothetical protein